jgi:hypothetical protein
MFSGYIHTVLFFVFGRLIFCSGGKFVIIEEDFETSKNGSGLRDSLPGTSQALAGSRFLAAPRAWADISPPCPR